MASKIAFLPFWAPCILKTVRDRKNRLNNSESSHWEESNEKNPIKIGWKMKLWHTCDIPRFWRETHTFWSNLTLPRACNDISLLNKFVKIQIFSNYSHFLSLTERLAMSVLITGDTLITPQVNNTLITQQVNRLIIVDWIDAVLIAVN